MLFVIPGPENRINMADLIYMVSIAAKKQMDFVDLLSFFIFVIGRKSLWSFLPWTWSSGRSDWYTLEDERRKEPTAITHEKEPTATSMELCSSR